MTGPLDVLRDAAAERDHRDLDRSAASLAGPVAAGPFLRADVAARLLHRRVDVRAQLASNPACPPALLPALAHDRSPKVRQAAARHPRCPFELAVDVGLPPTEHRSCPPALLSAAAARPRVPDHVLRHRQLPDADRQRLLADAGPSEWPTVKALLENPATTHTEALSVLTGRPLPALVRAWTRSPNADPDWLADVADRSGVVDGASGSASALALAGNPATPPRILSLLAVGTGFADRAVANPNCPADAMRAALAGPARVGWADSRRLAIALHPLAPLDALGSISVRELDQVLAPFVLAQTRTAAAAAVMLGLFGSFRGSAGNLVVAAAGISG